MIAWLKRHSSVDGWLTVLAVGLCLLSVGLYALTVVYVLKAMP